ncbi:MAG: YjjG family noncanonical pyrimidine nucleotidase [Flavobacteriaceae bacterium]|nr:YjjG family noncanonical pyrimidine nucleotidase [Flavobacteriaceae bacterium]
MRDRIQHIFFDLDHTLWDFDRNSKLAFEQLFLAHSITVDLDAFMKVYEPINFAYWKRYREERVTKQELRRGRFFEAFLPFGIHFSDTELDILATTYIDELPKNNFLFEGAMEVLQYLSEKYILHIITNGFEEVQHLKLKNSGILPYFKTVTTSEEVGLKKPNPVIFQKALEKAVAHPKISIMIGDTFEADILGAEAVGMETLFYNYRNESIPPQYRVINRILDIKKHL